MSDGRQTVAPSPMELWALCALGCERELTPGVLERLVPPRLHAPLTEKIPGWLERGWVREDARARGWSIAVGRLYGAGQPSARSLSLSPGLHLELLQQLAASQGPQSLQELGQLCRAALGERSLAALPLALFQGNIANLERATRCISLQFGKDAPGLMRSALWEITEAGFDATWLESTWGEQAPRLAEQALRDALFTAAPSGRLYAWSVGLAPERCGPSLAQCVAEHGLWRGQSTALDPLEGRHSASAALAWSAALALVTESQQVAQERLDAYLAWSAAASAESRQRRASEASPGSSTLAGLLALLALGRQSPQGEALALRWVRRTPREVPALASWPPSGGFAAVGKNIRRLVKYASEPDERMPRLDAHQLPARATAWEVLLTAMAAHRYCDSDVSRAAWAGRMEKEAARFQQSEYTWIAEQAAELAEALGRGSELLARRASQLQQEPPTALLAQASSEPSSRSLAQLLGKRPVWRQPLAALAAFAGNASPSEGLRRATWYIDMTHRSLAQPELETFSAGGGWAAGPRVPLAELFEIQNTLPPEDARVLRLLAPFRHLPELESEALDALCGHPRVVDGARGRLPVDVVRGRCRLHQRKEDGHWLLSVAPNHAKPGVWCEVNSPTRVTVYRVNEAVARLAELLPKPLRIPEAYAGELGRIVAALSEHLEVQADGNQTPHSTLAQSTPCLRIALEAGAFWVEVGVRPFGEQGRFFPTARGEARALARSAVGPAGGAPERRQGRSRLEATLPSASGAPRSIARDFPKELARRRALLEACPTLQAALDRYSESESESERTLPTAATLGEEELFGLLTELSNSKLEYFVEWQNTRPIALRGQARSGALRGALKRSKGWYIATGGIHIEGLTEVALAELVRLPFTRSGRFVRLPSGDFIELEQRLRLALSSLALHAQRPSPKAAGPRELHISEAAFSALTPLLDPEVGFRVEPATRQHLEQLRTRTAAPIALPEGLNAQLRDYQIEGYAWLYRMTQLGFGVCLADDMGLGKTLQVLAWLLRRKSASLGHRDKPQTPAGAPHRQPCLVVAPTSVCSNWVREAARFAPGLRVAELVGSGRRRVLERCGPAAEGRLDLLVASYGVLQQDRTEMSQLHWDAVVLDEAQFIKNPLSLRARATFGLRARARVALSGTPIENHLGELWSVLHFLNPRLLGTTKNFELTYQKPIERDGSDSRRNDLKQLISPFFLRRSKAQVLSELPALTRVRHEVTFSSDEALRYAVLRRQIHEKLFSAHGRRQNKIQALAELTKLRRFCCHPRLVFPEADLQCSKLDSLLNILEELRSNGHRALVFSQFVDFLNIVKEQLSERGFRYQFLHGGTPKAERQAQVDAFQSGSADLFLISLKAGGFGLNLTAASYVIHLDPWWNPASQAQASDRAHRIGQAHPVTVYQLVAKNSIEERVLQLHEQKRALAESLLDDPALTGTAVDWQAIETLLSPKSGWPE